MNAPATAAAIAAPAKYERLPLEVIKPSLTNPRKHFDPVKLEELAASIRLHDVMQPIVVRPCTPSGYELVAGERRLRAAKLTELATIPAVIRTLTDIQVLEMQVVENLQRDDLHPIEEADGYDKLIKKHGYTADSLAEKIGKSRSYIYGRLKLAALTPKSRDLFYDGKFDASIALLVARIPRDQQDAAAKEIIENDLNYRQAADFVHEQYMIELKGAPFPLDDATLAPKAGTCKACPKRSGNAKDLFTDVSNPNICTDPGCFNQKEEAFKARKRAELEAKGETIIAGAQAKKIKPNTYGSLKEGYVALEDHDYLGGEYRTFRKAIGKQPCATVLLEDPDTGKLTPIAKREDVNAALKANGVKPGGRHSGSSNGQEKAQEAKARLETKIRLRILEGIRAASRARHFDRADTILVACEFFERLHFDTGKRLVDAWNEAAGIAKPKGHDYIHAFAKKIPEMSDTDLGVLFLDMALIGDCHVASYCTASTTTLLATAKRCGVNAEKIRADLTEAAKEKQAAKKKAVKK